MYHFLSEESKVKVAWSVQLLRLTTVQFLAWCAVMLSRFPQVRHSAYQDGHALAELVRTRNAKKNNNCRLMPRKDEALVVFKSFANLFKVTIMH